MLQAKLQESELERCTIRQEYDTDIRKHQEASFKQMESARWLPQDEGKVVDDLGRLKRSMRSWEKGTSVKDVSLLWSLEQTELGDLIGYLAQVVLLENNRLPSALLSAARAPVLLLNALLAHSIYTSFFRTQFFFIDSSDNENLSKVMSGGFLEWMYQQAQNANQQDAHIWRSQTLRLWMPPLRNDISDAERKIRNITEGLIGQNANKRASDFLKGPARHLINDESKIDYTTKLKNIYQEAASISYNLWTRRSELKCFTLHEMNNLTFDAESPYFDPDSLVKYEDYEDQLRVYQSL